MHVGAYRSYTAWIHGFLGKHYRIPIPSCVIKAIWTAYPDPQGNYTGFKFYMDLTENNLDFQLNFYLVTHNELCWKSHNLRQILQTWIVPGGRILLHHV
ncbi:hypothetical protein GDO78_016412 [Eleutherodactylus coqui]|uniref:P2X purinoreceptor 7 intracellular domain-containing protein n=1 Tax=Eleutherodactylus coqui TaxID=57060 RepID=A0A8J6EBW1_ELECQ|nr:hypothetical protein GDO78_016412 [Eleutherodactylus coqui]